MREEILKYLAELRLRTFTTSAELPFDNNKVELYIKNPKRIYVDNPQISVQPFIQIMNGHDIDLEVQTVAIYFTTDAKQLPTDYSSTVASIRAGKAITLTGNFFKRESDCTTEYKQDLLVTKIELKYSRIITS